MGENLDSHQARLNSMISCRCGEGSPACPPLPDDRSELSYVDPNASPATPASSAILESNSGSHSSRVNPHWPLRTAEDWERFREAAMEDEVMREGEFQREAEELPSPAVWHDALPGAPSPGSDFDGRLVEIKEDEERVSDKSEDPPKEVSSLLFPSWLGKLMQIFRTPLLCG